VVEHLHAVGGISVPRRVTVQCQKPGCRIIFANGVAKERANPVSSITNAGSIIKERVKPSRYVIVARGVTIARSNPVSHVVGTAGVVKESLHPVGEIEI